MPEAVEIKDVMQAIEGQGAAFEEYKKANDQRLEEIAKKGAADPLLEGKLVRINADLDKFKETLDAFEVAQKRTSKTYVDKDGNPIDLDAKAQEWRDRVARARQEKSDTFAHDDLMAYKSNFLHFARKSKENLGVDELKALSVGSDPDGGYLVPPDMTNIISRKIFETSPVRQYARVQVTGRDQMEGFYDDNEASFGWVGETGSRAETNTPEIGKWVIPVAEAYANPATTQRLLDDADFNVEQWLSDKIADKLARAENAAFCTGSGVSRPRGFMTYANGTSIREQVEQVKTGVNGGFAAAPNGGDALIDALYKLKSQYRSRAVWFMNRSTAAEVRKLKDSNGQYLWAPGLAAGQPASLMGYPTADFEDMADIAAGSLSIAVGDLGSAYLIAERMGIRVLRDPYTNKPNVLFYTTKRVGGGLVNGEAIKIIDFSA